jgi:hypothetical protein
MKTIFRKFNNWKILVVFLHCLCPIRSFSQKIGNENNKFIVSTIYLSRQELNDIFDEIILKRNLPKHEFPIINQSAAREFINQIFQNSISSNIEINIKEYWNELYLKKENKYPAIFISHPIDYKALYGNKVEKDKASNEYEILCKKMKTLTLLLESLFKERDSKILLSVIDPCKGLKKDVDAKIITKEISDINQSINILQIELSKIETNIKQIEENINMYSPRIIENNEAILKYILNKEQDDWDDYLLNKTQILFVITGGKKDLSNATIKIENKPSSFQTSLIEFEELATQLGVIQKGKDDNQCCKSPELNDSISIKFVLIKKDEIKAPSTICISEEKSKLDLKFDNHEKARFGITVGVSASKFERKNFIIDPQNNLTIMTDSLQKNEWKGNLMLMLNWYPTGRDIDRLEPIWKNKKEMGLFDPNRFAITSGLKLSKDPLESCFLGISYSLSKEFSLTGGLAFNATPKNITDLPVGMNASLDYLKSNSERSLVASWYFGITLSPGSMSKALGFK